MDRNTVLKIVKKRKTIIGLSYFIIFLMAFGVFFAMDSSAKYSITLFIVIIGVYMINKVSDPTYILFDECNPRLYYAVAQKLRKQVPIDKQVLVADFVGDYSSAVQIEENMIASVKNDMAKAFHHSCIARIAFSAGDYELCKSAIASFDEYFSAAKKNSKIQKAYEIEKIRHNFYLSFISGDYQNAKVYINEYDCKAKSKKNSFKCTMLYYNALVDYALGDTQKASDEFSTIVENYENMHFATVSKEYLEAIKNSEQIKVSNVPISSLPKTPLPQSAQIKKLSKNDIVKLVVGLIILLLIFFVPKITESIIESEAKADTPAQAVANYYDDGAVIVNQSKVISIDDNYEVLLFVTNQESVGVAYMEHDNEKYICKTSNLEEKVFIGFSDGKYMNMHSSGICPEITYRWQTDDANIDEGYTAVEFNVNNEKYYFVYKLSPPERHFANGYRLLTD